MIATYPCKGCQERRVGCHSTCRAYQTAKTTNDAHRAAVHHEQAQQAIANTFHSENVKRMKKRMEMH